MRWLLFALSITLLVFGGCLLIGAVKAPAAQAQVPGENAETGVQAAAAVQADRIFVGPWKTTNRKLDGIMTCVLKDQGHDKWEGRFYGVWQGVPFDYTVNFVGSPSGFKGKAVIDNADYAWSGSIDDSQPAVFSGTFGGSRYTGSFALKETKRTPAVSSAASKPRATVER